MTEVAVDLKVPEQTGGPLKDQTSSALPIILTADK